MNGCSFLTIFLRGFILLPTERAKLLLKKRTRDFQNSPLFERPACSYVKISANFESFQYLYFETDFLDTKPFSKICSSVI